MPSPRPIKQISPTRWWCPECGGKFVCKEGARRHRTHDGECRTREEMPDVGLEWNTKGQAWRLRRLGADE